MFFYAGFYCTSLSSVHLIQKLSYAVEVSSKSLRSLPKWPSCLILEVLTRGISLPEIFVWRWSQNPQTWSETEKLNFNHFVSKLIIEKPCILKQRQILVFLLFCCFVVFVVFRFEGTCAKLWSCLLHIIIFLIMIIS